MSEARLRALIVDDEPLAREVLRGMLAEEPDVEIVGEAGDGVSALTMVERLAPDLLFLDVQMPERDGFAVLRELTDREPERMPAIIFVTAYDQYAVRAFEVHALDYLLKPFDEERLQLTMERAREHLRKERGGSVAGGGALDDDASRRVLRLLDELGVAKQWLERIVVREDERVFFVRATDVDWFEAAGKYITLHVGKQRHQIREAMGRLERTLDPRRFTRLSRFAIVNIERIRELQPWFQGEYVVILTDGTRLTTTRGYRENLNALLGKAEKGE